MHDAIIALGFLAAVADRSGLGFLPAWEHLMHLARSVPTFVALPPRPAAHPSPQAVLHRPFETMWWLQVASTSYWRGGRNAMETLAMVRIVLQAAAVAWRSRSAAGL